MLPPLAQGTRLGPYEILEFIGQGGMGEAYRARDTRLDRIVAIKTSRQKFSDRFEREAKAAAALNHPHICSLYDVGPDYLVMEFVEGKPLNGPLRRPLPPAEALRLALQIADALDAAHEKGILHRGLKPGNILVTNDGRVKVLDFGLAMTRDDIVAGVPLYMSPEEICGHVVDARSDIWSFGVVLYELVAGTLPLPVFALPNNPPVPLRERNPLVSAGLAAIIGKALERDREMRYQSAADLRTDLKRLERASSGLKAFACAMIRRIPWREG